MLDYRMTTFCTLCEVMNYRKTAELLHLTQPAITQHIQFLEKEYNCKLFSYENKKLSKTKEAVILEEYAKSMRYQEESLRNKLGEKNETLELKIGATKTIGDYMINENIYNFLENKCNNLILIVDNTKRLLQMLEDGELDFAIIEGFFDKNKYDYKCIRKEPFVGICNKSHPFSGKSISVSELLHETIIHREEGSGTRAILEQRLKESNESIDRFKKKICISSFKLILDLVKKGIGVSFVYKIIADSDENITTFSINGEKIIREFNIVYLKHTQIEEQINIFFNNSIL